MASRRVINMNENEASLKNMSTSESAYYGLTNKSTSSLILGKANVSRISMLSLLERTVSVLPEGHTLFDEVTITKYLSKIPKLCDLVGISGPNEASILKVKEVGDGYVNFVFVIEGPSGTIVIKQGGDSLRKADMAVPLNRANFENKCLIQFHKDAPAHVPEVFHYDEKNCITAMRYIQPPHIVLRKCFVKGMKLSTISSDLANILSRTLFNNSYLALSGEVFRQRVAEWSQNFEMVEMLNEIIYSSMFDSKSTNVKWLSPHVDGFVIFLRTDFTILQAVEAIKTKLLTSPQTLIHADMHLGGFMACEGSTFVMDPEFANYGPIAADLGRLMGSWFNIFFCQPALYGEDYAEWTLNEITSFYSKFESSFLQLWNIQISKEGELYQKHTFSGERLQIVQKRFMNQLWQDTVAFIATNSLNSILGLIGDAGGMEDIEEVTKRDISARISVDKKIYLFAIKCLKLTFEGLADEVSDVHHLSELARSIYYGKDPTVDDL